MTRFLRKLWYSMMPRLLQGEVICSTAHAVEKMRRLGIRVPDHLVTVIPFGIDLQRWEANRIPPPRGRTLEIGSAGNLVPSKRFDLLIAALKELPESVQVRLRIAGEGPLKANLCKQVAEITNERLQIEFVGLVEDMLPFYDTIDVFAFSAEDESFGLVALEALVRGRAVIVSKDVGGCLQLIKHKVNGLVLEPTPEAWRAAIISLAADQESLEDLQRGAAETDLSKYDIRETRAALDRLARREYMSA